MRHYLFVSLILLANAACAADLVVLSQENISRYLPQGKEVDCIYGDFAMKSDKLCVVIAQPTPWRNANMFVVGVGGAILDLTTVEDSNDQLSAYFANLGARFESAQPSVTDNRAILTLKAPAVTAKPAEGDKAAIAAVPEHVLSYELQDGQPFVLVRSILKNTTEQAMELSLSDTIRLDAFDARIANGNHDFVWAEDRFFYQSYAVSADKLRIKFISEGHINRLGFLADGETNKLSLKPGESYELVRRVFPARDSLRVSGLVLKALQQPVCEAALSVKDERGHPVADIEVALSQNNVLVGAGRTLLDGTLNCAVRPGKYDVKLSTSGHGTTTAVLELAGDKSATEFKVPLAPVVIARITDKDGKPIPCKVQFKGVNGTPNPKWGNNRCAVAVENLYYSHTGKFGVRIDPGEYEAIVSYGAEYNVERVPLKVVRGTGDTLLHATLKRAVKSPGWVKCDFHSHSSPSGDNASDQRGRVLNLLCENLEFNPCTEHNRIDSYTPHLKELGVEKLMGTCTGIECTGNPLPIAHHNVFPLHMHPHTQDGGGPSRGPDHTAQIKRVAEWDNNAEKVVQQNHPDIGSLFFDKNTDGTPDGGWTESFPYIHIIEVHPIHAILKMKATNRSMTMEYNSTIFNWLQLLNQGYRLPGVVNTDAHYNNHGSGGIFNFVRCSEETPGDIDPLEIVRACKKGNIVMSNGPFLDVKLGKALPGDDVKLNKGKGSLQVKVQCPNWLDISRVQVLVNGRPDPRYNFTRDANADKFGTGVVKFDQKIEIDLDDDAHLIVVAIHETQLVGDVMGDGWGKSNPVAVSNPIYADVDGDGFMPNKDTLGAPLPVRGGVPIGDKK